MATYLDSLGENQFLVVKDINHPRQELLIDANNLNNEYNYIEVNLSTAQILDLHNTPVTILGNPGANKYYDIEKIIVEFTPGKDKYDANTDTSRIQSILYNSYFTEFSNAIFAETSNSVYVLNSYTNNSNGSYFIMNDGFDIQSISQITGGDGIAMLKIWYNIKTFGTEL